MIAISTTARKEYLAGVSIVLPCGTCHRRLTYLSCHCILLSVP